MPRTETEPNWLVGFDLDDSSYSLTQPESFLDSEAVTVAWPVDTAHGYRAQRAPDIDFVSAGAGETPHSRQAAVLCDPGPGASNRQLVAQHCEISDPVYLTTWGVKRGMKCPLIRELKCPLIIGLNVRQLPDQFDTTNTSFSFSERGFGRPNNPAFRFSLSR